MSATIVSNNILAGYSIDTHNIQTPSQFHTVPNTMPRRLRSCYILKTYFSMPNGISPRTAKSTCIAIPLSSDMLRMLFMTVVDSVRNRLHLRNMKLPMRKAKCTFQEKYLSSGMTPDDRLLALSIQLQMMIGLKWLISETPHDYARQSSIRTLSMSWTGFHRKVWIQTAVTTVSAMTALTGFLHSEDLALPFCISTNTHINS